MSLTAAYLLYIRHFCGSHFSGLTLCNYKYPWLETLKFLRKYDGSCVKENFFLKLLRRYTVQWPHLLERVIQSSSIIWCWNKMHVRLNRYTFWYSCRRNIHRCRFMSERHIVRVNGTDPFAVLNVNCCATALRAFLPFLCFWNQGLEDRTVSYKCIRERCA